MIYEDFENQCSLFSVHYSAPPSPTHRTPTLLFHQKKQNFAFSGLIVNCSLPALRNFSKAGSIVN